jgi:hypothetical protein
VRIISALMLFFFVWARKALEISCKIGTSPDALIQILVQLLSPKKPLLDSTALYNWLKFTDIFDS